MDYASAFEAKLAALIDERIAHLKDNLATAGAITDYAAYCLTVGKIEGLKLVADLRDEANDILAKR